jgi:flagellin
MPSLSKSRIWPSDSGYKGKNLLAGAGNELEVIFNEDSTSNLTVNPVDFTDTTLDTGLNLDDLATGPAARLRLTVWRQRTS